MEGVPEPKSVTIWRLTLPECYQANCPGLTDPSARNGHYQRLSGSRGVAPMGLHEAAVNVAKEFPDHRYIDAQPWDGPDEDHNTIYHLRAHVSDEGEQIITMLRRSVKREGRWEPESQLWWPEYRHVEPQEA
jgi:hypothetical protein